MFADYSRLSVDLVLSGDSLYSRVVINFKINMKIEGSEILSGGIAGPEGSIITTILFFIILPILLIFIKKFK